MSRATPSNRFAISFNMLPIDLITLHCSPIESVKLLKLRAVSCCRAAKLAYSFEAERKCAAYPKKIRLIRKTDHAIISPATTAPVIQLAVLALFAAPALFLLRLLHCFLIRRWLYSLAVQASIGQTSAANLPLAQSRHFHDTF